MAGAPGDRRGKGQIGFMILWLVFWLAGILIAVVSLGRSVLDGELGAGVFLLVWLVAAGFGLVSGARRLRGLLLKEPPPPVRLPPSRGWRDGFSEGTGAPGGDGSDEPGIGESGSLRRFPPK